MRGLDKNFSRYLDPQGFPGCVDPHGFWDGGDTAAILGTLAALTPNEEDARQWAHKITSLIPEGVPLRHPDSSQWYGQSDRFSRDQLIPIICTCIRFPDIPELKKFYQAHSQKLFMLAWNKRKNGAMEAPSKPLDFTGPEIWALWLRYKKPWWAQLILWFLDIETLLGTVHWRYFRKDRVTRNHMLITLYSKKYSPTFVSKISYRLLNWADLIRRWSDHCEAVGEYPTANLFCNDSCY